MNESRIWKKKKKDLLKTASLLELLPFPAPEILLLRIHMARDRKAKNLCTGDSYSRWVRENQTEK